ncbi:MAG TPA: GNAT family N-acetyltransferase [Gemmataceae bacterium]|jgi:ribosomal protein S18 acetylase RimI-like enzyme|nr:GNAT family N-acetyltransferase [Gemmataceae bacterium]
MTVAPANADQLAHALAILFGHAEPQIGHAFRLVARGDLNASDFLVTRAHSSIDGAIYARRLAGGIAVIWPPRGVSGEVERALVESAIEHVAGANVIQVFLPPDEVHRAEPLLWAGFQHVTALWQMARSVVATYARPECTPLLSLAHDATQSELEATLLRAHEDSLDCPELNRCLSPAEVLAGYDDAAPDRSQWLLARDKDRPVGVALLDSDNLMFLGAIPERRRQGIGRWLLNRVLELAPNLYLNVDARNTPAVQLYRSAGFEVVDVREVFLYLQNSRKS